MKSLNKTLLKIFGMIFFIGPLAHCFLLLPYSLKLKKQPQIVNSHCLFLLGMQQLFFSAQLSAFSYYLKLKES